MFVANSYLIFFSDIVLGIYIVNIYVQKEEEKGSNNLLRKEKITLSYNINIDSYAIIMGNLGPYFQKHNSASSFYNNL